MADVKTISGVFTGAYAMHPFTGEKVQIWIGDYVLAGYGTGAVMAVPCGDERDYAFAKHFGIEIINIFEGVDISEEAFTDKENSIIANSDFLNGLPYKKAMKTIIYEIEKRGFGYGKINYRLRDAVFSRQRYWGEPIPIIHCEKCGMDHVPEDELPLVLPKVDKFEPGEDGASPLSNIPEFVNTTCPTCGGHVTKVPNTRDRKLYCSGCGIYRHRDIMAGHNIANILKSQEMSKWHLIIG